MQVTPCKVLFRSFPYKMFGNTLLPVCLEAECVAGIDDETMAGV